MENIIIVVEIHTNIHIKIVKMLTKYVCFDQINTII